MTYNIAAAFRGPDSLHEAAQILKGELTLRIRTLGTVDGLMHGKTVASPLLTVDTVHDALARLPQTPEHQHFVSHLLEALLDSRRASVWGGYGDDLIVELTLWGYPR